MHVYAWSHFVFTQQNIEVRHLSRYPYNAFKITSMASVETESHAVLHIIVVLYVNETS